MAFCVMASDKMGVTEMGCLFVLFAAFAPRLAFLFLWIFTPLVDRAFHTFIWPFLGIIFLPLTTLVYTLAYVPALGGLSGWGWLWVIFAFILDITAYAGSGYGNRE